MCNKVCATLCATLAFYSTFSAFSATERETKIETKEREKMLASVHENACESVCESVQKSVPESVPESLRGRIELIMGPMFSGKSSELQRRLTRFSISRKQCFLVQYARDTRYTDGATALTTHDRRALPAHCAVSFLKDAASSVPPGTHVIAVDEAQFFPDAVEVCQAWANAGKVVLLAALDSTFEREPFSITARLIAIAEQVDKLVAVCAVCGHDKALWSHRTTDSTALEVIGGQDTYQPLCRKCWKM